MRELKLLVAGKWSDGERKVQVRSPFDDQVVAQVAQASDADVEQALAFAESSRREVARASAGERRAVLHAVTEKLKARADDFASVLVEEAGKPITLARTEVRRAIETMTLAAAELTAPSGSVVPVDLDEASAGYHCEVRRFPAGIVVGIVPFNFALNLGMHKVAPALAVGAPIVIKPPPQAPSAQLMLAELVLASGAHPAALQVLPCDNARAEKLATDERVRVLSFTGSERVGWALQKKARGKVLLELGGNAAVLLCPDADLEWAAERVVAGAFGYAGQVCIKVQRVYAHEAVRGRFRELLLARARAVVRGDPRDERTLVGPVIDEANAERVEAWVAEALRDGATRWLGGEREGRVLAPTILYSPRPDAKVVSEEVFGPVLTVEPVATVEEGISRINSSRFGLQAGVFTRDLRTVRQAFEELEVGGVIINDAPTFRSDNAPYGGVKASGLGREGVRYAMTEMTEERALILANH